MIYLNMMIKYLILINLTKYQIMKLSLITEQMNCIKTLKMISIVHLINIISPERKICQSNKINKNGM